MSSNESGVPVTSTPASAGGEGRYTYDRHDVFSPNGENGWVLVSVRDASSIADELNRLLDRKRAALAAVRELREAANGLLAWWDCEDRSLTAVEAARLSTEYMHTLRTALANTKDIAP